MKKALVFTAVLLLLISASSFGTETRVLTMGDNNLVLLDDANIWLFPSRVFEYSNLAVGEFSNQGGNDFTQFGIHWKFGSDNPMVFGTYFTDLPAEEPGDLAGGDLVPFDTTLLNNRRIDFFYGNELGDFKFGSRFSIYCSGQEWDEATPAIDQSKELFRYLDFDFGLTPSSGSWDLAVNVAFGTWTDEGVDGQAETEPDGFTEMSVLGRHFWQRGPDYTFVPHVSFFHLKRGIINHVVDADPGTTEDLIDNYTLTGFDLGFGLNYTPASNVLAVCDLGFLYEKWKHERQDNLASTSGEETFSSTSLPYFKIGLDADVFKWMDIRLGATSYWTMEATEDRGANNEFKSKSADNETYLGFGFHWGRLQVDTYTDPQVFLNGFDFISGNGAGNMNFRISALYEMM
ncbi:MAG: hypothetical protein V3T31_09290 [candidate division Zixibacteria bacterium]